MEPMTLGRPCPAHSPAHGEARPAPPALLRTPEGSEPGPHCPSATPEGLADIWTDLEATSPVFVPAQVTPFYLCCRFSRVTRPPHSRQHESHCV